MKDYRAVRRFMPAYLAGSSSKLTAEMLDSIKKLSSRMNLSGFAGGFDEARVGKSSFWLFRCSIRSPAQLRARLSLPGWRCQRKVSDH